MTRGRVDTGDELTQGRVRVDPGRVDPGESWLGREYVMRWFGFPRTGRNDLFVAPVNRDTNKNVCPHIATKTWPRNRRFCSVRYVDFYSKFLTCVYRKANTHVCLLLPVLLPVLLLKYLFLAKSLNFFAVGFEVEL